MLKQIAVLPSKYYERQCNMEKRGVTKYFVVVVFLLFLNSIYYNFSGKYDEYDYEKVLR